MSDDLPPTGQPDPGPAARRPGDDLAARSATALAALAAPDHAPGFWDDLDRTFADEPQLRLAPRSAIRPITQPPPVIDDRTVVEGAGPLPGPTPRRRRRRTVLWVVVVAVIGLAAAGAIQGAGGGTETDGGGGASAAEDGPPTATGPTAPEAASGEAEEPEGTEGEVDPHDQLEPSGVDPLRVGIPLGELRNGGVGITIDERTLEGSGYTCFDATVHGAPDLRLRFRSPDPDVPMDDPAAGRLVAVDVEADRLAGGATERPVADTDVKLGTSEQAVLMLYAGELQETPHPFEPRGHVYVAPVGDGTGVAFGTDGEVVTSIAVGLEEVIRVLDGCG
ncbi:MAG: hypothetical protein ACLFXM_09545 [Acidimicrobiia bacterium]